MQAQLVQKNAEIVVLKARNGSSDMMVGKNVVSVVLIFVPGLVSRKNVSEVMYASLIIYGNLCNGEIMV